MRSNRSDDESEKCNLILQRYFKHTSFRAHQLKIILNTINGGDSLVIMATGSGKSLCYQIPPVLCGKAAIVVSPLVSLIQNQVEALRSKGITSIAFTGASKPTQIDYKQAFENNSYSVIYLTPEGLNGILHHIKKLNRTHGLCCIAIDESHCVSEWGHDFRPQYKKLHILRDNFPFIPILALTATATKRVQNDIISSLKLGTHHHPLTHIVSTFNRPNLYYHIKAKKDIERDLCYAQCKKEYYKSGSTIIYTTTQKLAETIANTLVKYGINASGYHAGMRHKERREIQNKWEHNDIQCIVATIAFGMGIDKTDIRYVIHYGVPDSIESYYQQTGRAGRDGNTAHCVLFWSEGDFSKCNWRASNSNCTEYQDLIVEQSRLMKQFVHSRECTVKHILRYFGEEYTECGDRCDNCIQNKKRNSNHDIAKDFTEQGKYLVMACSDTQQRFGINAVIDFVNGKDNTNTKKIYNKESMVSFAKLKDYSINWIKALSRKVIEMGFLEEKWTKINSGSNTGGYRFKGFKRICVTQKGRELMRGCCRMPPFIPEHDMLKAQRELKSKTSASSKWQFKAVKATPKSKTKPSTKWAFNNSNVGTKRNHSEMGNILRDRGSIVAKKRKVSTVSVEQYYPLSTLKEGCSKTEAEVEVEPLKEKLSNEKETSDAFKERLIAFRKRLSTKRGLIPYQVINNDGINLLHKYRPSDISHLEMITDLKQVFIKNYGGYFCKLISKWCRDNSIPRNVDVGNDDEMCKLDELNVSNVAINESNHHHHITVPDVTNQSKEIYKAFVCGDNIEDIVKQRVISRSCVERCLSNMIINGYNIGESDWNRLPFSAKHMKSCFMVLSKDGVKAPYDSIRNGDKALLGDLSDSQLDLLIARYMVDDLKKRNRDNDEKQWNVQDDDVLWQERDECVIEIARKWQRSERFIMDRMCYLRERFGQSMICNRLHVLCEEDMKADDGKWSVEQDVCLYDNRDCSVDMLRNHFGVGDDVIKLRLMHLSGIDMKIRSRMDEFRNNNNDDIEMDTASDNINRDNNAVIHQLLSNASNGISFQEFGATLDIKSDELKQILQELTESFQVYMTNDRYFAF